MNEAKLIKQNLTGTHTVNVCSLVLRAFLFLILIILCNYLNKLIFQVISILLYAAKILYAAKKTQYDRTKAYFYIFTYIYNYTLTCSRWVSIEMASGFYLTTGHKVLQLFV